MRAGPLALLSVLLLVVLSVAEASQRKLHVSPDGFDFETEQPPEVMASNPPPDWSHLKGKHSDEAKAEILRTHPHLKVHVVDAKGMVTMDYREDRVRLFVDAESKVVKPPKTG
eukprot:CAMPEP_0206253478 /NCGR_PEP_ID=MMETSP0047_2-20121206/23171_1 /ASSEMBLY_ACC=CAM_ASM_000192 /TAXON_ID=195065 /ORGANISM="Chroomonas mesostigmatica_cf, Strain CCMP1168" /LENGTH=112 /DNA_ID=CAMNT_0053679685 /DNA_START=51 /DNA_END=389 /DNA_ORIENTATION=-